MLDNKFLIRYSALNFQKGYEIVKNLETESIDKILADKEDKFQDKLLSVAPKLILDKGNRSKIDTTKIKYMDRAATRTTPLGLLAGVLKGNFEQKGNYNIDFDKEKLQITIDREWLNKVLVRIENKIAFDRLSLNPAIYVFEDKIINKWVVEDKNSQEHDIEVTPPLKEVLRLLTKKEWVRDDLINYLASKYNQSKEVISNFIIQLIHENVILSDAFNLILVKDPLDSFIQYLVANRNSKLNYLLTQLRNIKSLITLMEKRGSLISNYQRVVEKMKKLALASHYLHIDLYNFSNINLPASEKKKIEELERFLVLTSKHKDSLLEFKNEFKDKYSVNTLVNFKDLFNPRTGLTSIKVDHVENEWLKKVLYNSLRKGSDSLKLEDEKWVTDLRDNADRSKLDNISTEIALIPFIKKDQFVYSISPLVGSMGTGNIGGRFDNFDIFKPRDNEYQLIFNPQIKRVANILRSLDNRKTISFNTYPVPNGISVKEVYILLDSKDYFHLFYNGKEISTSYFSMVNKEVTPTELTFLSAIKSEKRDIFQIIRLIEKYKESNFVTPEVWYHNFLISGKSWNIKYYLTEETKIEDLKEYLLRKLNKVDRIVYWTNGDNRILINLNSTFFINELVKSIKKQGYVRLERCYFTSENLLLHNLSEKYLGEFIFSFTNDTDAQDINTDCINPLQIHKPAISRQNSYFLSSKWCEFQIYLRSEDMNDFLSKNELLSDIQVPYFYIRYKSADKGDHIRLRFQLQNHFELEIFRIISYLEAIYKKQIIKDLSVNIYNREIDRYGQRHIDQVEHIFYLESQLAIDILKKYNDNKNRMWDIVLYHNLSLLIKVIGLDKSVKIFDKNYKFKNKIFLNKEYRKYKKQRLTDVENLSDNPIFIEVIKELRRLNAEESDSIFIETVQSLQHLFHNRVIGIDIESETRMNYFIKKHLQVLWYTSKESVNKK